MKQQYGEENLDLKYTNPEWLHEVEYIVSEAIENTKKKKK